MSQSNTPQLPVLYLIHLLPGVISSIKIMPLFINVQTSAACSKTIFGAMIKKNKIQSVSQMYFNNQELAIWVMYEADYFDQGCIIWI